MSRCLSSSVVLTCGAMAALGVLFSAGRRARASAAVPESRTPTAAPFVHRRGSARMTGLPDPTRNRDHSARDRAEALSRRKQDFLGLLSHELRNPLSAIQVALAVMRVRENIASGQPSATAVMGSWMRSPGHRANILDCSLTRLGVGMATGPGGPWWTQLFA